MIILVSCFDYQLARVGCDIPFIFDVKQEENRYKNGAHCGASCQNISEKNTDSKQKSIMKILCHQIKTEKRVFEVQCCASIERSDLYYIVLMLTSFIT